MGMGRHGRDRGTRLGITAFVVVMGLSVTAGMAFAGKRPSPPPPSSQTIYYQFDASTAGSWHSMNTAGGDKTALPSAAGIGMSRVPHGGAYLSVFLRPNAANGTTPYSEALPDLAVQPVSSGSPESTVVVVAGGRFQFNGDTRACFLPGDDTILTFTAIEWNEGRTSVMRAGFYQVTLTYDGSGAVTEATAPSLLFTIPWEQRSLEGGIVHQMACRQGFDWLGPTTVVWGAQGTKVPAVRVLKTVVPDVPTDYSSCSTEVVAEDAGGPVTVNPSLDRLTFSTVAGLVETDAVGGNRYLWVPRTYGSKKDSFPRAPCYADDDTLVYLYYVMSYTTNTATQDVYVIARGGRGTNLTGDVSGWPTPWVVR